MNLANSSSTQILGTGTATFTADVFGESKNISLDNTLFVPDLRTNLISVSKITNKNFEVLVKKDSAHVIDKTEQVKLVADRIGELYYCIRCQILR